MTESENTSKITDSVQAAVYALQELLLAKDALDLQRQLVRGFRVASRRFRRVHRAIERQTLSLVSDLTSMGMEPEAIGALIRSAQAEALKRRTALRIELSHDSIDSDSTESITP